MASNTRSLAESKKQETNAYLQTLDKKKSDNIAAVSGTPSSSGNTGVQTNSVGDTYKAYSEAFNTNAVQYDEQIATLQKQEQGTENLRKQDGIIAGYMKAIDTEVSEKKQQQLTQKTAAAKNKIAQQIKELQSKRAGLNKTLLANQKIVKESNINTNTATNNTLSQETNTTQGRNVNQGGVESLKYLGSTGFEIKTGNAYNEAHPIPINEKLPDGLIYRVQIGAFKNPIPLDEFKGLAPIGGETTPQGFIRYQAGMFDQYDHANRVKNDLKKLGYKDAFVVVYLNGKRINLADAIVSSEKKGEPVNSNTTTTAGITAESNIPTNTQPTNNTTENTQPVQSGNLTAVNGLLFTIQIGVYTNNVSNAQLRNLKPIYREQLSDGNYRYTAGIYSDLELVKADRRKVNALGISDAFVSAYLNGQRIKISDAIEKVSTDKTLQFPKQQPIIFSEEGAGVAPVSNAAANTNPLPESTNTTATVQQPIAIGVEPFTNGVKEGPAPTAENGVKANDEGITFKVQIGAYRKQVPQQIADTWLKLKTWPIKSIQVNDLYIYAVGSYTEARFAQKLKDEVVALGMKDAFITVFKDGKKLYGNEVQKYLTR